VLTFRSCLFLLPGPCEQLGSGGSSRLEQGAPSQPPGPRSPGRSAETPLWRVGQAQSHRHCSAAVCRARGFAGHGGLQGGGVCSVQGFAGWLRAPTKLGPRAVCLALGTEDWLRLPPARQRQGFRVVTRLWSQPVLAVAAWVPGARATVQGFPMSFGHGSGQPVLLSLISIRFQLKPNAFSSLSCTPFKPFQK